MDDEYITYLDFSRTYYLLKHLFFIITLKYHKTFYQIGSF
jgi:hypothetical protein